LAQMRSCGDGDLFWKPLELLFCPGRSEAPTDPMWWVSKSKTALEKMQGLK